MESVEFKNGGEVKLTKSDMLKKLYSYHKHIGSPAIAAKYKNLNTAFRVKTGKSYEDLIGGKANSMNEYDLAKKHGINVEVINQQLKKGQKVELGHIDNNIIVREIVLDHLFDAPDYYDRLEMMEKQSGIKHTIDTLSHLSNAQIKSIKNYLSSKDLSDGDIEVHSNGNIIIYKELDNNTLKQIKFYLKNTLI